MTDRLKATVVLGLLTLFVAAASANDSPELDEISSKTLDIEKGSVSFVVHDQTLNITATLEAYPKSSLEIVSSADGEDIEETSDPESDIPLKEYDLILREADAISSIYKENKTVSKTIDFDENIELQLTYKIDKAKSGIIPYSGMLVTVENSTRISISKNSFSVSGVEETRPETKSPEVSEDYVRNLDNMTKEELKNRVISLRAKVKALKQALMNVQYAINDVENLVREDPSEDINYSIEEREEDEDERNGLAGFLGRLF